MALLLIALALAGFSCGKKGPPLPPLKDAPPAVAEIEARVDGEMMTLSWPLAPYRSDMRARPAGFRVYRAMEKLDEEKCPDCPPLFQQAAEISLDVIDEQTPMAVYNEILEAGCRYHYRVIPFMEDGAETAPSRTVTIDR